MNETVEKVGLPSTKICICCKYCFYIVSVVNVIKWLPMLGVLYTV